MRPWFRSAAGAVLLASASGAHDGPPFPILEDVRIGPYTVSLWTDPDIPMATVFVLLSPPRDLPPDLQVRLGVQPLSGRLPESWHTLKGDPQKTWVFYPAEVPMDSQEVFRLRVRLESSAGGGEAAAEVEATPDGMLGPIGLVLYLLPFLGVGFLWVMAVLKRRKSAE